MFDTKKIKIIVNNIIYLVSGNIASLILGFLFNIYIAKNLGASEYGVFSTVEAFVALFGFLVFEGYQKVAIRECCKNTEKLVNIIESILGIKIVLSLLGVFCTIIASLFFNYTQTLIIYISVFSFNLLFGSISSMLQVVYHVNSKMKYIAYTDLIRKLIYILSAGTCVWFKGGVKYLIIFFTISTFLDIFINLYVIKKVFSISFSVKNLFVYKFNIIFFKEAFVFSLLGFIGYFHRTIDITMLSWMVLSEGVGFYSAASRLIMPLHLLGRVTKVALFPQFMEIFKTQKTIKASHLFKISGLIAICMIPIALFISIFSEQIIFYTFGEDFLGSAEVLKYLSWMIPFGILALPFSVSMTANHHEKKMIMPNILRSASNVILNFILIKKYGYMGAVYSTVITYFWYHIIINFGYQYYVLKKAGNIV
ncbi:flippase [Desulfobacula phenolica]|uniref:Membrane protein involved in the export of O-antigen and teichoic acid n=1 Tax=Desulfobacula phenolica TaxID=90732 RepID=A0A1H2DTY1_9BACT|nr:flippase [Desulfobacula phenolica]SDT86307.1 Membrane protein involved in the export of O-antigen and teichoic acid [Desulfobacula phenolica]